MHGLAVGESNGEAVPTDVATEVEHFSMGHTTTKSNEDFFNKARKLQKLSSTGKVGGAALWHCSLTSPIMAESDMACAQPSAEDRVEGKANAQQGLDSDSFDARHVSEFSLGDDKVDEYRKGGAWPKLSTERFLRRPFALLCLKECCPDWQRLKRAWQAKLVQPGALIVRTEGALHASAGWVLNTTDHGVVVWNVKLKQLPDGQRYMVPVTVADTDMPWRFVVLDHHQDWCILDITVLPPTGCAPIQFASSSSAWLAWCGVEDADRKARAPPSPCCQNGFSRSDGADDGEASQT